MIRALPALAALTAFALAAALHAQGLEALEKAPGATPYEKAKSLFDQASMPKGPDELEGWFGGRWFEPEKAVRGTLLGVEGVPGKREDPASAEVLILATWSDEDATWWDAMAPDKLTRTQDMLRRGPRDGVLKLDPAEKAAVINGLWDDGKFRYQYSLRVHGSALVMRYDYEHRRVTYGYYPRKIMPAAAR